MLAGGEMDALIGLAGLADGCSLDVYLCELTAALNERPLLPLAAWAAAAELFNAVHPADPDVPSLALALWLAATMADSMQLSPRASAVARDVLVRLCAGGEPADATLVSSVDVRLGPLCVVLTALFLSMLLAAANGARAAEPLRALRSGERGAFAAMVTDALPAV